MINALIFQKLSHFFRCEVSRVVRFQFFRYTILTECLMHALNYFFTIYVLEKRQNGIPASSRLQSLADVPGRALGSGCPQRLSTNTVLEEENL